MRSVVAIVALALAGCASTDHAATPPQELAAKMTVSDSGFDKQRLFIAPPINGSNDKLSSTDYVAQLIAMQDKGTKQVTHGLSVRLLYTAPAWRFFNRATLLGGTELQTRVVKREPISCSLIGCLYSEEVVFFIPLEFLVSIKSGFMLPVRVSGGGDAVVVNLQHNYLQGYLQGVERLSGGG